MLSQSLPFLSQTGKGVDEGLPMWPGSSPSSAQFPLQTPSLGKDGVGDLGLNSFGNPRDQLNADEMFRDQMSILESHFAVVSQKC